MRPGRVKALCHTIILQGLAGAALLAGCADPSGIVARGTLHEAPALAAREVKFSDAQWPVGEWWQQFRDPMLDGLVQRALEGHPTLEIAQARLTRAMSAQVLAAASLQPSVSGSVDSTRQRYSATGIVPPALAGKMATLNNALVQASWELDFFGRNQSLLLAAIGQARAAQADVQAARNLLAAQVATQYFQLARHQLQRGLAQRVVKHREQIAELLTLRVRAGLDTGIEREQALAVIAQARLQGQVLDEQIQLAQNFLAALTQQPLEAVQAMQATLPEVRPQQVPMAIPSDLLGRRADLVAARWRVEAALRDRDVAQAQFYPNINLVAFAGFTSLGFSRWLTGDSATYGLGPALRLPLFSNGTLRANLTGRTADLDLAIASYNQTLNDAAREVADQIVAARAIAEQQRELDGALDASRSARALATRRHRAGLSPYASVLVTEAALLAQQATQIDLATRLALNQVDLIRALGGGFPGGELPTARIVHRNAPQ